ncbi:hypothetical protein ACSQ67_015491 [Phaseolus vulgaris]
MRRVHRFGVRLVAFMLAYHGRLAALHDFNKLLPPFADVNKEHENCSMFFMTLGFYGLVQEYVATYDKILGSLVNPTTTSASFALLCILQKINTETHTLSAEENTVFASLSNNSGPSHEGSHDCSSSVTTLLCCNQLGLQLWAHGSGFENHRGFQSFCLNSALWIISCRFLAMSVSAFKASDLIFLIWFVLVDPLEKLDPEVADILVDIAENFLESIIRSGCSLAKHRKSTTLEAKDILLHLEKNWNMTLPGFGGDEIKSYRRQITSDIHKERLSAIKKSMTATELAHAKGSAGQASGSAKGNQAKTPMNIIGSPNLKNS